MDNHYWFLFQVISFNREKEKLVDKGRSPNEISKSRLAAEQIEKWLKSKGY